MSVLSLKSISIPSFERPLLTVLLIFWILASDSPDPKVRLNVPLAFIESELPTPSIVIRSAPIEAPSFTRLECIIEYIETGAQLLLWPGGAYQILSITIFLPLICVSAQARVSLSLATARLFSPSRSGRSCSPKRYLPRQASG